MAFHVYVWRNTKNQKHYVGQTIKGYAMRWVNHQSTARRGGTDAFHRAIRKHGEEAFELVELWEFEEKRHLSVYERALISAYDSFGPNGYNMTPGGEEAPSKTPEVAARIADAKRGNKNPMKRPEVRAKVSARLREISWKWSGNNHPTKRPEVAAKISASKRGEKNASATLTSADVITIRELAAHSSLSRAQIAQMYNCTRSNIHAIVCGRSWAHLN